MIWRLSGSIIHSSKTELQDMLKYGGLIQYLPFSYTAI
jgi:NADH-ubiquinone oxidoreductase chain 5